jgi:hypothetical protein
MGVPSRRIGIRLTGRRGLRGESADLRPIIALAGEIRREMAKKRRLLDDAVRSDLIALASDEVQNLDHVIKMGLRIDAARKREPDQLMRSRNLAASID